MGVGTQHVRRRNANTTARLHIHSNVVTSITHLPLTNPNLRLSGLAKNCAQA